VSIAFGEYVIFTVKLAGATAGAGFVFGCCANARVCVETPATEISRTRIAGTEKIKRLGMDAIVPQDLQAWERIRAAGGVDSAPG
jgi:hypothetical protein